MVLLLQTRRALSGLRLGISHPLRPLHRDSGEILFSGAGLPAVVCWWGDAGRAVAGALAPWGPRWVAAYAVGAGPESACCWPPRRCRCCPPPCMRRCMARAGNSGSQQESGDAYGLPQSLADRFGWEEQVALIAQVYHSLPPDEQRVACIYHRKLWRGGCARAIRRALSPAATDQRTQRLLSLGTGRDVPARCSSRSISLPRTPPRGTAR